MCRDGTFRPIYMCAERGGVSAAAAGQEPHGEGDGQQGQRAHLLHGLADAFIDKRDGFGGRIDDVRLLRPGFMCGNHEKYCAKNGKCTGDDA